MSFAFGRYKRLAMTICLMLIAQTSAAAGGEAGTDAKQSHAGLDALRAAAIAAYKRGAYSEAEQLFKKTLTQSQSGNERDWQRLDTLGLLAMVYRKTGRYAEAIECLETGTKTIDKEASSKVHAEPLLSSMATLYMEDDSNANARVAAQRLTLEALALHEKVTGLESTSLLPLLERLEILETDRRALQLVKERIYKIKQKNPFFTADVRSFSMVFQLAALCRANGDVDKAEFYAHKLLALTGARSAKGRGSVRDNNNALAHEKQATASEARALLLLGLLAGDRGDKTEAVRKISQSVDIGCRVRCKDNLQLSLLAAFWDTLPDKDLPQAAPVIKNALSQVRLFEKDPKTQAFVLKQAIWYYQKCNYANDVSLVLKRYMTELPKSFSDGEQWQRELQDAQAASIHLQMPSLALEFGQALKIEKDKATRAKMNSGASTVKQQDGEIQWPKF